MLNAIHFIKRQFISLLATAGASIFSIAVFHPGFWPGVGIIIGTYFITGTITKQVQLQQFCKQADITRLEYKHIEKQLAQAEHYIAQLGKFFFRVRSIHQFKQMTDIHRLAKSIVKIVKNEPKKFYHVESFFYAHLETATQLTDKYTMLSKQPLKDKEIQLAITDTRATLTDLHETLEQDLKLALSNDIEHLKMEIEFAKLSNRQQTEQLDWRGDKQ